MGLRAVPPGAGRTPEGGRLTERVVVRRGAFHDPATLMEASRAARALPDVEHVAVGMVEPLNLAILSQRFGYPVAADGLGPNDLVIALRADGEAAAEAALGVIEQCLAARAGEREVLDVGPFRLGGDRGAERVDRVRWQVAEPGCGAELLERLTRRAGRIAAANDGAVGRMQAARPVVVGVAMAGDVLPAMSRRTFLH